MVEFNRVIDGLVRYMNKNIFPKMIPEQRAAVRTILGMGLEKIEKIRPLLIENGFIKTFGIINLNGEVDVDFVFFLQFDKGYKGVGSNFDIKQIFAFFCRKSSKNLRNDKV